MSHLKEALQISFSISGAIPTSTTVVRYPVVTQVTFPADLTSSLGVLAGTHPSQGVALTIQEDAADIAYILIDTAGTVSFITVGGTSKTILVGSILTIDTPANTYGATELGVTLIGDR